MEQLTRIYSLKTEGLEKVLADINAIKEAFKGSGVVTNEMAAATTGLGNNLSATAAQMSKMQGAIENVTKAKKESVSEDDKLAKRVLDNELKKAEAADAAVTKKINLMLKEQAARSAQIDKEIADEDKLEKKVLDNELKKIEILQEAERVAKEHQTAEQARLEKLTTEYGRLNAEYKEAAALAVELGAKKVRLQSEIGNGVNVDSNTSELARLGPNLTAAKDKALLLHKALLEIDQTVGRSQRNVGNYNGAVMAMSQILREAPSFAYSTATGILAISNNLPILIDEIERLVAANKALAAEGKATIPVWKTLSQSLLSVNGLITIGVAALTIFTARMAMAGNETSNTTKKVDGLSDSIKTVNDIFANMAINISTSTSEELNKAQRLIDAYKDGRTSLVGKTNAYIELQGMYPKILTALTDEEKKTLTITAAHEKEFESLNKVIGLKNKMSEIDKLINADLKVKIETEAQMAELRKKFSEESERQVNRLIAQQKTGTHPNSNFPAQGVDNDAINKYLDYRDKTLKYEAAIAAWKKDQLKYVIDIANTENAPFVKDKKSKQPHDYTNEQIAADKALTDNIAKELELRLQLEMAEQKAIFSNLENSLADRLKAHTQYAYDQITILQLLNDTEVKETKAKLEKIAEIESKPFDKRTTEEQTLFLNKPQLEKKIEDLAAELKLGMYNLSTSINSEIAGIVKSGLDTEFKNIDEELNSQITKINNKYDVDREGIFKGKGSRESKEKKVKKIDQKAAIESDEAKLIDDAEKINDTEIAMQQAHNLKLVELEADLRRQLVALYRQESEDRKKLHADENKSDKDAAKIRAAWQNAALEIATSFANSYMALLEKRANYEDYLNHRNLEWNYKQQQALTQSKQQQIATDKAYYAAQEQLAHEKAVKDKKRAETQMAIDYALAVMRIWANYKGDFGITEAIQIGAVSAMYAAQLAMVESAPAYAEGIYGERSHPGGLAWVGDGGEHELIKIGNKLSMSPNTATPVNLPAGAQVIPMSHITNYTGTMGSQLQAPKFVSSSTGGNSDYAASFAQIHATMQTVAMGLANMKVVQQDAGQMGNYLKKSHYKKVTL